MPKHFGEVSKPFGFPNESIITGDGLKQDNWTKQGLYINYQYRDRRNGIANLLVVITTDKAEDQYLRVLARLSMRPASFIQGVLA